MNNLIVFFTIALISLNVFSAPVQVYGPQKFSASLSGSTYNKSFTHSANNSQGVLTVINGSGSDLSLKNCNGLGLIQQILCRAQNIVISLQIALLRPSSIQVFVNGQLKVTSTDLPANKDQFQTSIVVNQTNNLKVVVKGSPASNITVGIKAESAAINKAPIANFIFTPSSGIAPEIIAFSGLLSSDSDGSISSYEWTFGDGGAAIGAAPTHAYSTTGLFQISLTVTDNQGARTTKVQSISILQNQLPVAAFTMLPDPQNPLKIKYNASTSTDADNVIVSYNWNFGDTQGGTGVIPEHIYQDFGTYSVMLTVTDSKGGISSKVIPVTIVDNRPLEILSLSPVAGSVFKQGFVKISGTTNKNISEAYLTTENGTHNALAIDSSGKSFMSNINFADTGPQILTVTTKSLSGQTATVSIQIFINSAQFWRYSECSTQDLEL